LGHLARRRLDVERLAAESAGEREHLDQQPARDTEASRRRPDEEALALATAVVEPAHGHHADRLALEPREQHRPVRRSVEVGEVGVLAARRWLDLGQVLADQRLGPGTLLAQQERGLRVLERRGDADGLELGRAHSPSSWIAISRMRYFWTFPVTVIGNESTMRQ